jgi:hypothetical protein
MAKITRDEFDSIRMIYLNINFAYSDHEYLSVYKLDIIKAAFIDQNQTFFNRLKYYLYHFTVIELNKVFNNPETYSLGKYINFELKDLPTNHQNRKDLLELKNKINLKSTRELLCKINNIRNGVSAHLDSDRDKLVGISIPVAEIEFLMETLKVFVCLFNKIVLNEEYVNPITNEILGHKLHNQYAKSITK